MQAISVRCPECNAVVDAGGGDLVTCSYCGAKARVQRRTQFFQRPVPLPPMRPEDPQAIAVARASRTGVYIMVGVAATFLVVVAVAIGASGSHASSSTGAPGTVESASANGEAPAPPYWRGGPPLVHDVDGDGIDDLIGIRRYMSDKDGMTLFALSGKDGHVLWETPDLGKYMEVYQDPFALAGKAGDVIVRADRVANLVGYAAKDGKQLWTQAFGEVVKNVCDGHVQTADEKWWTLDAATGAHTAVEPPAKKSRAPAVRCGVVQIVGAQFDKTTNAEVLDERPELPNMHTKKLYARGDGLPAIAIAYRSPGTAVSMLAAVSGPKWDKVEWATEVPATDVLRAEQWGVEAIALDEDAVVTIYEHDGNDTQTLTLFARADGKRRWVVPVDKHGSGSTTISGYALTRDAIVIGFYGELRSYERSTGALRWSIGKS